MKINGTLTSKSGSWIQVKKHASRNWKTDKNEDNVNKALSKYNVHDKYEDIKHTDDRYKDKLLKLHYMPFVKQRNLKFRKQHHLNRQQSLAEYLKNKTPSALGIATFGTMDDKAFMMSLINEAYCDRSRHENAVRYYKCANDAFKHYVISFNRRNKYIKITHFWTNGDELGAPHVHFEMVPLGFTKLDSNGRPTKPHFAKYKSGKRKGRFHRVSGSKPTGNLTKAVCMEFHTNNNRSAFKQWNDVETKAIVRTVGKTFQRRFGKVHDWIFQRQHTGRQGSLSMKSYKATWHEIDRKNNQLAIRNDKISKKERDFIPLERTYNRYSTEVPKLAERNDDLMNQNDYLDGEISTQRDDLASLNQQRSRLTRIIEKLKLKKKRLKQWLHDKWIKYRDRHLSGFYRGLARGIKYVYPEIQSAINSLNKSHQNQRCSYYDFATGKLTWGNQENGHVGGIKLFLRGLAKKGRGFFANYQNSRDLSRSFSNSKQPDKHPDDPSDENELE